MPINVCEELFCVMKTTNVMGNFEVYVTILTFSKFLHENCAQKWTAKLCNYEVIYSSSGFYIFCIRETDL
jgi:hypothetical protein